MANSMTRAEARTFIRQLIRDNPSVSANQGLSDTTLNALIDEARSDYAAIYPDQFTGQLTFGSAPTVTPSDGKLTITPNIVVRNITGMSFNVGTDFKPAKQEGSLTTLLDAQGNDTTVGLPTKFFAMRALNHDTNWIIHMHPIPDIAYTPRFYGIVEPTELSGDSSQVLFNFSGSRTIARMAAVRACPLLGRSSEYASVLASDLPDKVRARMLEEVRAKGSRASESHIG